MKNTVNEMIRAFSREEFREFKYFLNRQNNHVHERVDLKIVDMIRKGSEDETDNRQALHQSKSKLKKQLEFFAAMENTRFNNSSRIQGRIEMAKYLFRKNLYNHAWDYLIKAEQMALQSEEYELLNYIYYIQISFSYDIAVPPPPSLSVPSLLDKRNHNLAFAKTDGNANAAYASLIHELRELFARKLDADVNELVNKTFEQYGLHDDAIYQDKLKIHFKIVTIVCRALREKRDYVNLREYSIKNYQVIKRKKIEDKMSTEYMLNLFDMICIGTLRSRDYKNYEKFQQLYTLTARKLMASPDEYSYYDFIPSIDLADLYMCTDRLDMARECLLKVQKKYVDYKQSVRIYFLLRSNLIAMHFKSNSYKTCIALYNEIMSVGEKKILSERGFRLDLLLMTEIYGVIFYYEIDDADHAHYMLNRLKRKYKSVLNDDVSIREITFIKIMEKMINDSSFLKSKTFQKEYERFMKIKDFVPGDNEYISLNAWLTAKYTGQSYYSCFLNLVR